VIKSRNKISGKYGRYAELKNSMDVPEGKRQPVSPRCSWEYNFIM
jgi:hypothetical protein